MKHFTCIGRSHGAPAIPATREDWEKARRDSRLADICRRIAAGKEKLKRLLPIWTPCCAGFKNNHRAVKDVLVPLQRLMLDFDEKGHSQEILQRSLQLQEEGKWEILLVEESVRRGTHVLITLPEGMTPQEAQQRFSKDVGFEADPALKDMARCIYLVPEEYVLWMDAEKLFAPCSPHPNLGSTAQQKVDAPEILRRNAPLDDNLYPQTYENIPYESIVETLEEQMGGQPRAR